MLRFFLVAVCVALVNADCNSDQIKAAVAGGKCAQVSVCAPMTRPQFDTSCCPSCKPSCTGDQISDAKASCPVPTTTCAAGAAPSFTGACCPSCSPPKQCTSDQIQACATAPTTICVSSPTIDPSTCCPSCKKPESSTCTDEKIKACATNTNIPTCTAEQKPTLSADTCCPSCRPAKPATMSCAVPIETIPECATGVRPNMDATGCPSCRPTGNACTSDQIEKCKAASATLPACASGVQPTRDSSCCLTCKPTASSDAQCTDEQVSKCKSMQATLPTCKSASEAVFDPATCCRSCAPPKQDGTSGTSGDQCTAALKEACLLNVPVCAAGEKPVPVPNTCCLSCKSPARLCSTFAVSQCQMAARPCATGEVPTTLSGECCGSCMPAPPTCSPACTTGNLCVNLPAGASCRPTHTFTFNLAPATKAVEDSLTKVTEADTPKTLSQILKVVVGRYCDTHDCSAAGDFLNAVSISVAVGADAQATIVVPELDMGSTAVADVIKAAFADRDAAAGFSTENTNKCTKEQVQACTASPADCTPGQVPVISTTSCCPSCKPKSCTDEQKRACDAKTIPACAEDAKPTYDAASCCPTCRPKPQGQPSCSLDPKTIPACSGTQKPERQENGCPTCTPAEGSVCTADQRTACAAAAASLAVCADGVEPRRDTNCCMTCKPSSEKTKCTDAAKATCAATMDSLPACDAASSSAFDPATCCRTCKPTKATPSTKDDAGRPKCTADDFAKCKLTTPVCSSSEDRIAPPEGTSCCASCIRPERSCDINVVAKCVANARECAAGEKPSHISGECCMSCRPAKPVCSPACGTTQVCLGVKDTSATDGTVTKKMTCVDKATIAVTFKGMTSPSATTVEPLVLEAINRFCDKYAARCEAFGAALSQVSVTNVNVGTDGTVTATVTAGTGTGAAPAGFERLLATVVVSDIINGALTDTEATGGITATTTAGSGSGSSSAGSSTVASMSVLAVGIVALFGARLF